MSQEEFDKIIENRLCKTKELLLIKSKEYIRNNDPLHNFNVGNRITGKSQLEILDGFMLKHYISYRDLLDDVSKGKEIKIEQIREKIGDLIVYLCIQETMFEEYCEIQSKTLSLKENIENL